MDPAWQSAISGLLGKNDFADQEVRQLVNDQRIEISLRSRQRECDAASVRLLWGDRVTDGVSNDFVSCQ
jgi:hypothetical protein